jgi:hypothetical protein
MQSVTCTSVGTGLATCYLPPSKPSHITSNSGRLIQCAGISPLQKDLDLDCADIATGWLAGFHRSCSAGKHVSGAVTGPQYAWKPSRNKMPLPRLLMEQHSHAAPVHAARSGDDGWPGGKKRRGVAGRETYGTKEIGTHAQS